MSISPSSEMVFMHISDIRVQRFISRIDRQLTVHIKECAWTDKRQIDIVLEEKIPREEVLERVVQIYRSIGWNVQVTDKGTFWVLTLHV